MKIVFLGGFLPDYWQSEILSNSKGVIQFAADALQNSFIEGLSTLSDSLEVLNLPIIGSWPKRYKSIYSPKSFRGVIKTHSGKYILNNQRFLNVTVIKAFDRYIKTKNSLKKICKSNIGEPIYVIIYSIHSPFIEAAVSLKKVYPNLKIILIVPDLPEYMNDKTSFMFRTILSLIIKRQNKLYSHIDGFVLLSEYMRERLITNDQPYCVVEGIYDDKTKIEKSQRNNNRKIIFYSGTLARRYCIMNLVNAITKLNRSDFELNIYGDGNCKEDIINISKKDSRIKYCGQRPRSEILKLQQESYLLVNPRTADGEFTKYSFPSKTMEYLASGVPTLIYRLPGIPNEYYNYCYSLSDSSVETLSQEINNILNKDINELNSLGQSAQEFILKNKNPLIQCKKVMNLIEIIKKLN